jgi:hypothetical protein
MPRITSRNIQTRRGSTEEPHDIGALVRSFIAALVSAVEQNTTHRIQVALVGGGAAAGRTLRRGRPRAKQLCPVPGCAHPAAPVFGMVCAEHKGVAKKKIREYREARRRAKTEGTGQGRSPGRPRSATRSRPKPTRRAPPRRTSVAKPAEATAGSAA